MDYLISGFVFAHIVVGYLILDVCLKKDMFE